jgi:hypothetical protein
MNITLKRTEEQVELVKAMASKNRNVAHEAQAAAAEFIGPVLSEIMNNAPTLSNMFTSFSFNDDDNPSIPLDLYHDVTGSDYLEVYSQSVAGGLPSNSVIPTHSELKFATYRMETAVDFDRRYAAKSRLDVVSKTFTRVAQELLIKQENTSANLVLGVLAVASTNSQSHVVKSANANQFLLADVNALLTRAKRINTAWNGGTPVSGTRGVTDLLISPEVMGEVRAMAYNPINSKGSGTAGAKQAGDVLPATESMRNDMYNNAGASELYGITLTEINELGVGQRFNDVYKALLNSGGISSSGVAQTPTKVDPGVPSGNIGHSTDEAGEFDQSGDEIVIGIDRGRDSLMRAVAVDADSGAELRLIADDQYSVRQNKIGYYGQMEEGRMVLDSRAVTGIVV